MSRRAYPDADSYDDRRTDSYTRPRTERNYDELDVDIRETRARDPARRPAATLVDDRRTEIDRRAAPRQPDFLRSDYGRSEAGPLVVRERDREEDIYSRAPPRRRSVESMRSERRPAERVEEERLVIRERERDRRPPYPSSELGTRRGGREEEELDIRFRERERSRPPPPKSAVNGEEIDIDIDIDHRDRSRGPAAPRSDYGRSEYRERDVEEIRFRRGPGDRPPPPRSVVNKEEIDIDIDIDRRSRAPRSSPPRSEYRGREVNKEEIDIRIREQDRSAPPPRARSVSRGALVAKEREEWIVRRRREPSPPPPPRDFEKEEIIIRRRERTPSPEPVREPTPPPPPPPPPEPIVRPPIIQEVITHHRHVDHGFERARTPTPPPLPAPSPLREENLEIEIRRQGVRNGKAYDEDIIFERDVLDRKSRDDHREISRRRSLSASTRRRSPSPIRRRYEDDVAGEAEYYQRRVASRAYPGEAYNGATKDWALVDIPPGTEKVRMDGVGGGAQEISWERYNGQRRLDFTSGDRTYQGPYANGGLRDLPPPAPAPPALRERGGEHIDIDIDRSRGGGERIDIDIDRRERARGVPREDRGEKTKLEIDITERRINEETQRGRTKDKMWTEITKDLVIKEAIEEMGYEYEETEGFFYVIEYLRYEDVLRLVQLTEDIRRERRERIREIQWEREELDRLPKMLPAPPAPPPVPAPPRSAYEERIYEREYYYDRDGRRYSNRR